MLIERASAHVGAICREPVLKKGGGGVGKADVNKGPHREEHAEIPRLT